MSRAIVLKKSFPYVIAVLTFTKSGDQHVEIRREVKGTKWVKVISFMNAKGDHMNVRQLKQFAK